MKYFPLFADLDDGARAGGRRRRAGGAEGAAPAARPAPASPSWPRPSPTSCASWSERTPSGSCCARSWRDDLDGQRLVYAATGDRALDAAVSRAAQARGIPVNVVDAPELSTFITPAIVDRDPVAVAIGTEGAAPVLAREIKTRLESWLPANLGALAGRAQALRASVAEQHSRSPRPPPCSGSGCFRARSAAPF